MPIPSMLVAALAAIIANQGLRVAGAPPWLRQAGSLAASVAAPSVMGPAVAAPGAASNVAPFSALSPGEGFELGVLPEGPGAAPLGPGQGFDVLQHLFGGSSALGAGPSSPPSPTPPPKPGGEGMNQALQGLMIGTLAKGLLFPSQARQSFRAPDVGGAPGRTGGFRPTSDPQLQALMQQIALNRQRRFFGFA